MRTRRLLPAVLLTLTVLAAACGTDDPAPPAGAPTTTPSPLPTTTAAAPAPSGSPGDETGEGDAPPFEADRSEDTSPGEGNGLSVVDVRTGTHEGYDRVVFELGGEGTAGWRVAYDDDPRRQGSGQEVDLEGDATLSVLLEGVGYPFDTGVEEYGGPRTLTPGHPVVREVELGGVYEGSFDAFVGVVQARPFRVFRLEGPQRVVVDVAHTG